MILRFSYEISKNLVSWVSSQDMKRFVSILLAWSVGIGITRAATRDQQWKQVDEDINKDLPKSAIETLTTTALRHAATTSSAFAMSGCA